MIIYNNNIFPFLRYQKLAIFSWGKRGSEKEWETCERLPDERKRASERGTERRPRARFAMSASRARKRFSCRPAVGEHRRGVDGPRLGFQVQCLPWSSAVVAVCNRKIVREIVDDARDAANLTHRTSHKSRDTDRSGHNRFGNRSYTRKIIATHVHRHTSNAESGTLSDWLPLQYPRGTTPSNRENRDVFRPGCPHRRRSNRSNRCSNRPFLNVHLPSHADFSFAGFAMSAEVVRLARGAIASSTSSIVLRTRPPPPETRRSAAHVRNARRRRRSWRTFTAVFHETFAFFPIIVLSSSLLLLLLQSIDLTR